jgi:serine O-acetyltransferase
MNTTLPFEALGGYIARQLGNFFPDDTSDTVEREVAASLPLALERMSAIVHAAAPRFFERDGTVWFKHLHSDQWAMFLYLLAHELARAGRSAEVATKLYLLNKALHGIDVFYEVRLPRLFLFMHPLGTVLGRAEYGDYFVVLQNCTVGNVGGKYPRLGKGVMLCAGASILGPAEVGDDVTIGAGSLIMNTDIPTGATAVGRGKDVRLLTSETPLWRRYFRV